tara:strand:+ start:246 stop:857 length:612 start_codon:yes stop_codon:yes gene_type:complete
MSTKLTTPKGRAKYPHVNEPNTRFNPMGEYSCTLVVSSEDANDFKAKVDKIYEAEYDRECMIQKKKSLKKATSYPILMDEDGDWIIKTKQVAKVESKSGDVYNFDVKLFDAAGKPVKPSVGSGSIVKCAVEPRTWYVPSLGFGITLSLKAVQVIDLVEIGGSNADAFGFSEEEGYQGESLDEAFKDDDSEPVAAETSSEDFDF